MCGIAGFIGFEKNIQYAEQANEIQKHRGPDSQAVWSNQFLSFSHQRLSIIDLSKRSDQPLIKNEFVIIYNGEVYNYKELKIKYLSDVTFKTGSDTEVVLEMYKRFGEKALDYFIGMFSFVIYNEKENKIFGARDHFGIKPFYFYKKEKQFAFASELKTLAKILPHNKKINKKALIASLNYLWIPGNESIFEEFNKLPPAHYFNFDIISSEIYFSRYWNLPTKITKKSELFSIIFKVSTLNLPPRPILMLLGLFIFFKSLKLLNT